MQAVIRSGGKQYRVAPGDILNLEKLPSGPNAQVEWQQVLAVRDEQGRWQPAAGARVSGTVLAQFKDSKILVFHYKRKKQYKKLQGHRQPLTRVRIDSIQPA